MAPLLQGQVLNNAVNVFVLFRFASLCACRDCITYHVWFQGPIGCFGPWSCAWEGGLEWAPGLGWAVQGLMPHGVAGAGRNAFLDWAWEGEGVTANRRAHTKPREEATGKWNRFGEQMGDGKGGGQWGGQWGGQARGHGGGLGQGLGAGREEGRQRGGQGTS